MVYDTRFLLKIRILGGHLMCHVGQCTAACDFLSRATLNQNFGRDECGVQTGYESHEVPVLGRKEMADPPGSGYSALIHSYDISAKPGIGGSDALGSRR